MFLDDMQTPAPGGMPMDDGMGGTPTADEGTGTDEEKTGGEGEAV